MKLFEVNQAAAIIKETAHPDVNLIFGAVIDENMGENLRITVIATGFEGSSVSSKVKKIEPQQKVVPTQKHLPSMDMAEDKEDLDAKNSEKYEFTTRLNTDNLDVPTFLRNRN